MDDVVAFFDTNVIVAASIAEHAHHDAASARVARFAHGGAACAAHTLAEVFNTLTRTSAYGIPPADASVIVKHAASTYRLIALTGAETARAIEEAARDGLAGPVIFDALLVACARKSKARFIYTGNVRHFRRIAPDLATRIVEP